MRTRCALIVTVIVGVACAPSSALATFPGVNGRLLVTAFYLSGPDSDSQALYSFQPDGSGQTQLAAGGWDGVWSPNGTQIALEEWVNSEMQMTVMNADGTQQRAIPLSPAFNASCQTGTACPLIASWYPNGQDVLFIDGGALWKTNLNGATPQAVAPGKQVSAASLSPDGKQIAYVDENLDTVHVTDVSGLNDHVVAVPETNYRPWTVQWSPDSRQVIFDSVPTAGCCDTTTSIYEVSADGSNLHKVAAGVRPTFSPDGTKIAFESTSNYPNMQFVVANADGSNQQALSVAPEQDPVDYVDWQALP